MPRRPRATAVLAVAAGLLLAGCGKGTTVTAHGSEPHDPGARVCADLLPTESVTALLPAGERAQVREEQQPQARYPVLSCEVTAGSRTFTGSAYLFNMAGADLVQLPGLTPATSVGLTGTDVYGMADAGDAWLVQSCRVEGVTEPVPLLVRTRLHSEPGTDPGPDRRDDLARLTTELATGVAKVAGCGERTPVVTKSPEAPDPLRPLVEPEHTEVCDMFDPGLLGEAAAGPARDRWTIRQTTETPSLVRSCDLFLDGRRTLSFQMVYGWISPWAERPNQRGGLTRQLVVPGVPGPDPAAPGTVIGAVDGKLADGTPVAYRMTRHDGQDTPGEFLGAPVEKLFRGFVEGVTQPQPIGWDYPPVPAGAVWTYR